MKALSHRGIEAATKNFLTHPTFLGILLTFILSLTGFFKPTFLEFLDYKAFDALSAPGPDADISTVPVIIDIDEKSLKLHGQWPWPRYKMAILLNRLHAMGVRAVGIDIMFPEKDRTVIDDPSEDMLEYLRADIGIASVRESARYSDRLFAEAVSRSSAVLGFQFRFESSPEDVACPLLPPVTINVMQSEGRVQPHGGLIEATDVVCNLPDLTRAAHSAGFFNVSPDSDGILRSVPLLMKYKGEFYPSLALAVLMKAFNINKLLLQHDSSGDSLHLGNRNIPLASGGRLWVNFRGKGKAFAYISAADIMSGKTSSDALADKIVFLGTSAAGLKELRSTPTDPIYPGVEVHATVVDNYIRSDFLVRPFYASGFEVLLVLLTGMAFTVIFSRSNALLTLLSVCGGTIGLWTLSVLAFKMASVLLSPVLPILVLLTNFSSLSLLKFWREERKTKQYTRELALAQEAIIESMASLTETRDPETGGHIKRTQNYVRLLARTLRESPKHGSLLDDETIDLLYKSAPLHDIGKVGVPDGILLKPGKLSEKEFEEMKKHAVIGSNAIRATERKLGNTSFLRFAHDIAYTHHEKWNGSGYPQGLRGEEIPLCGRLMALADTYDALISQRVYKPPLTHEEAVRIIVKDKGTHFDPDVVDAFLTVSEEFRNIAREHGDSEKQNVLKPDDQATS